MPIERSSASRSPPQPDKSALQAPARSAPEPHPPPAANSGDGAAPEPTEPPVTVERVVADEAALRSTPTAAPVPPASALRRPDPPKDLPSAAAGVRSIDLELTPAAPNSPVAPLAQMEVTDEDTPSWRRPGSFRAKQQSTTPAASAAAASSNGNHVTSPSSPFKDRDNLNRSLSQPLPPPASPASPTAAATALGGAASPTFSSPGGSSSGSASSSISTLSAESEVTLRRAHSFESDERFVGPFLFLFPPPRRP